MNLDNYIREVEGDYDKFVSDLEVKDGIMFVGYDKTKQFLTSKIAEAYERGKNEITYDSYSLGWRDDEKHYRMILLIKDGKILHKEEVCDDILRVNGDVVREYNIKDYADKLLTQIRKEE